MAKFDIPKQYKQQTTTQGSALSNITVNNIEPDDSGNIEITAKDIKNVLTINDIPALPNNLITKDNFLQNITDLKVLPQLDAKNLTNIDSDNVIINYKFTPLNLEIESGDTANIAFLKTQGQINRMSKEKPQGNWWFDEKNGEDNVIVSTKVDDVDYNVTMEPFSKKIINIAYAHIDLVKKEPKEEKTLDESILNPEKIEEINLLVEQYLKKDLKAVGNKVTSVNNGNQYRPFKTFAFLKTRLIGEVSATINLPSIVNEFLDFSGLNNDEITVLGLGSAYQLVNTSLVTAGFSAPETIQSFKIKGCRFKPKNNFVGQFFCYAQSSQFNVIEDCLFDAPEEKTDLLNYLACVITQTDQRFIIKSNVFVPSNIKSKILFYNYDKYKAIVELDENDLMNEETEELYSGSRKDYEPTIIRDALNIEQTKTSVNLNNASGYEIEITEATAEKAGIITADYKKRLDALLAQANL